MYIIYPQKERGWRHYLLMVFAIAMIYPLLKMGGLLSTPLPENFQQIPNQEFALKTHQFTTEMVAQGKLHTLIENFLKLGKSFYQGTPSLDNLYPVYPSLLVTIAQNNFDEFVRNAIGFNFLLLFGFLILLFTTLRRTEGDVFAFIILSLLLIFPNFIFISQQFGSTLILLISCYLCWFNLVEEEEVHGKDLSSGLWAGIAFLTAPFGGILFLTTLLYFLVTFHIRLFKQKSFAYFLITFILVASPLLFRDLVLHSNAFYTLIQSIQNLSINPSLFLDYKFIWLIYFFGIGGLILDPNKKRKGFSLLIMVGAFLSGFTLLLLTLSAFYTAALIHFSLAKWLKKQLIWVGLLLTASLCTWSWYSYFA